MQRYLGWGIGHRNRADFPHEALDLVITDADRDLEASAPAEPASRTMNQDQPADAEELVDDDEAAWQGLVGDDGDGEDDALDERDIEGEQEGVGGEGEYEIDEVDYVY